MGTGVVGADEPEIGVLEAYHDPHILSWLTDPRLRLFHADHPGPFGQQIVVLPASRNLDFIEHALRAPDEVWGPARRGEGVLVFDASREGWPHHPERTRQLHDMVERVGAPLRQCVYLTQDRGYAADYQDHCRSLGAEPMSVINADYFIRRLLSFSERNGETSCTHRRKNFKLRARARERRFLSLNYTARPTKVLFLLRLLRDGLWDRGFLSFGGLDRMVGPKGLTRNRLEQRLFGLPGFEDLNSELQPLLATLDGMGEVVLGRPKSETSSIRLALDDHLAEYDGSWFSVVTETEMGDRLHRITEKPLKPLLNFHPMIVLGNPGSLSLIRSLGFQTFGGYFDERYDEEPNPRRRFEMVYQEVLRLCALDERELYRLEKAIYETLVFNAEWGLIQLPRLRRERLDRELVDSILAAARPQTSSLS